MPAGIAPGFVEWISRMDAGVRGDLEDCPANGLRRIGKTALDVDEVSISLRDQAGCLGKGQGLAGGADTGFEGQGDEFGFEVGGKHDHFSKMSRSLFF